MAKKARSSETSKARPAAQTELLPPEVAAGRSDDEAATPEDAVAQIVAGQSEIERAVSAMCDVSAAEKGALEPDADGAHYQVEDLTPEAAVRAIGHLVHGEPG